VLGNNTRCHTLLVGDNMQCAACICDGMQRALPPLVAGCGNVRKNSPPPQPGHAVKPFPGRNTTPHSTEWLRNTYLGIETDVLEAESAKIRSAPRSRDVLEVIAHPVEFGPS
jgi:hypothetical protein